MSAATFRLSTGAAASAELGPALGVGPADVAGAAGVADALAEARADGVAVAEGDAVTVAAALVVVARGRVLAFAVADAVGFFVGAFVGVGLGLDAETPGARRAVLFCQENPTDPPAGTVSDRAPFVEYTHPEPVDQNRPQYAFAGGIR